MASLQQIGKGIIQYITGALATAFGLLLVIAFTMVLASRLFNIDFEPYLLESARIMTGGKLISIEEVFTAEASKGIRVCEILRRNTDEDKPREWVVFYQFDTVGPTSWRQPCPDKSPRLVTIYDNDRGDPAIIFPYTLKAPDRDHLGEQGLEFEQFELVANKSAETENPIEELFFYGWGAGTVNQLTIFKFQQNTTKWDPPTNEKPRYVVIGSFAGSGGISFDPDTKRVTVLDRGPFDRSQLAVKNVYELRGEPGEESYMTEIGAASLSAPVQSTIDFGISPPTDILHTEFPEKIVLAFYQSLDPSYGRTEWIATDFLAEGSAARKNYDSGNLEHFGFNAGGGNITDLAVVQLQYFPDVEQSSGNENKTIEGPQPTRSRVEIGFSATQNGQRVFTSEPIGFRMSYDVGQWKIEERLY